MEITLINMEGYPNNKATIPSSVPSLTVDIIPVALSVPTGYVTLEIASIDLLNNHWTHFKFVMAGYTYVAQIEAMNSVSMNLIRYDYSIDCLKTFFINDTTGYKFFCERTTEKSRWNKMIYDPAVPVTSDIAVSELQKITGSLADDMRICVVTSIGAVPFTKTKKNSSAVGVFVLSNVYAFQFLIDYLMSREPISQNEAFGFKSDVVRSQILGCYLLPIKGDPPEGAIGTDFSVYDTATWGSPGDQLVLTGVTGFWLTDEMVGYNTIDLFHYTVNDFRDIAPFTTIKLYIPLIGYMTIDLSKLPEGNSLVQATYSVDYIGGSIDVYINNYDNVSTRIALPEVPLSTVTAPTLSQGFGSLAGIFSNLVQGNVFGAVGSGIGAIENNSRLTVSTTPASGFSGIVYSQGYYQFFKKKLAVDLDEWASTHGYIMHDYMPVFNNFSAFTEGEHYWLDASTHVKGEQWLADGVIAAFQNGFEY